MSRKESSLKLFYSLALDQRRQQENTNASLCAWNRLTIIIVNLPNSFLVNDFDKHLAMVLVLPLPALVDTGSNSPL